MTGQRTTSWGQLVVLLGAAMVIGLWGGLLALGWWLL